jgi:hypothetical protein
MGSLNYDLIISRTRFLATSLRMGAIYWQNGYDNMLMIPLELDFHSNPKGSSHFEFGPGFTPTFYFYPDYPNEYGYCLLVRLGYRYQKPCGGFLFRAGLTPGILLTEGDLIPLLGGGICLGWSFKHRK